MSSKVSDQPEPRESRLLAWHSQAAHLRLWLVLVFVLALDLGSKYAVFNWLGEPDPDSRPRTVQVVPHFLEFQTAYNQGAALGILQGYGALFVAIGGVAFGVLLLLFARSRAGQWFFHVGVGLVMAGALGNIYDRVVIGMVRDFMHITPRINVDIYGGWPAHGVWPWIWNVADASLITGVCIILLSQFRMPRPAEAAQGG
ncbi:MAG: Lipoprotein signal peptidase [Phycisphaerae bacterium]|nr:Lipoprotein signal peptidase [Phycisphaerae bacterium]